MPSPEVLDVAKLAAPVPGDNPAGADLRAASGPGSPYYAVKDARAAARAAERRIEGGEEDAPPADWKPVVTAGTKALEAGKDLEIVAYLIEGLVRVHGFAGLRDGFRLARELVTNFWDTAHPAPDPDDPPARTAALGGLNGEDAPGTLLAPINRVPITGDADDGPLSYFSFTQAQATGRIADPKARDARIADGAMSPEKFQRAVEGTPPAFYRTLFDDLAAAVEAVTEFGKAADEKCGGNGPPTSALTAALTAVKDVVTEAARAKLAVTQTVAAPDAKAEVKAATESGSVERNGSAAVSDGEKLPAVRNRDDAFNAILQLADYFRRNEPHSMVPFALEQAVRWARMPLPDLMLELIPDDDSRAALFKQVGIRPPAPAEDEEEGGGGKKKRR